MVKRKIKIYRDLIKRKIFLKKEIQKIILKSIVRNLQSNNIIRMHALNKILFLSRYTHISRQNNICFNTGRFGGVLKQFNLSRHSIKKVAKLNLLQNVKIKSW